MKSNQLVLNLTKTKSLLFGTAQKLAGATDFKILIQGKEIDQINKFCYLGVALDENLSWREHVSEVFHKVNKRLGLLSRIRSCLTIQAAKCIDSCLILPVFSQRSFDVLISREGKKEQRRSEPRRDWGEEMVKRTPASRSRSHGRNFCT